MTVIRRERQDRFSLIAKEAINDSRLSFRARGVLVWLLDKPDDWRIRAVSIAQHGTEGRDAVRAAMTELESLGYLSRIKHRDDSGKWSTEVVVRDEPTAFPQLVDGWKSAPGPENPASENQASVSQALIQELIPITDTETKMASGNPSAFERFWKAYPKKVDKRAGERAWKNAIKRADPETIIRAVEPYVRTAHPLFYKNPATWLNADAWLNEYPEPTEDRGYVVY